MDDESDQRWMYLALSLGARGLGNTWPNPSVGCVIILNDTRFFSTSFAVHCCLVWCVGVPQSFFTVHNECGSTFVEPLKSKKKYETTSEILFEPGTTQSTC